ncbi:unnamed protein product [Leuciscus chuanchicus]
MKLRFNVTVKVIEGELPSSPQTTGSSITSQTLESSGDKRTHSCRAPRVSGQRSSSCEPARSHDTAVADIEVWGPRAHLVLLTARQSRLFISLINSTLAGTRVAVHFSICQ